jgi:hypothetical protein
MTNLWTFEASTDADQELRVAIFNRIANRENWKMPIAAWIDRADFTDCYEAAVWFTGGGIQIAQHAENTDRVLVVGNGYYANIGA